MCKRSPKKDSEKNMCKRLPKKILIKIWFCSKKVKKIPHLTAPEKLGVPVYEDVSAVVLLAGDATRQHGREESILDLEKKNRIYVWAT
jgi:hypothetical protein